MFERKCENCGKLFWTGSSRKKLCGSLRDKTGCAQERKKMLTSQRYQAQKERLRNIRALFN